MEIGKMEALGEEAGWKRVDEGGQAMGIAWNGGERGEIGGERGEIGGERGKIGGEGKSGK
ncbi:hypothetical protein DW064_08420 [Segatella copri]|uniref:Uncharacterized protein n=1 Tax=Segatella copri TaxID=165179 RepID=A0AA93BLZ7_9BACT|nr:hypothetical protein DW064_08420 [Segatella copri]